MLRLPAALAAALVVSACCVGPVDPPPVDPCAPFGCVDSGRPFPFDGSVPPIPPPDLCDTAEFGAHCELSCARPGLTCYGERRASATVETDGGVATLEAVAFPGGMCSRPCAGDTDCGECARCVDHALAGRARLRGLVEGPGVCRRRCSSSFECGEGSACDPELGACVEACTSDEQCRFSTIDSDGDGVEDAIAYEPDTDLVCVAGRCRVATESIGDRCVDSSSCEPGFACLQSDVGVPGRCGRIGCTPGGCGDDAACVGTEPATTICAIGCVVGADAFGDRIGVSGHGLRCDVGFACVWTGAFLEPDGTPEGACVPGNYNEVTTPNVGAPCIDESECWSPYGRGACLRATAGATTGVCVVTECDPGGTGLRPAVATDEPICAASAATECLETHAGPTACAQVCEVAETCLPGWACVRPTVGTIRGARICAPECEADGDCRTGGRCVAPDASTCDADDVGCVCF